MTPEPGIGFRATAPVRLDFGGGWTDVAPFAARERGVVVNAAIALRATASLEPGGEGYRLLAEDLGEELTLATAAELATGDRLPLLRAALRRAAFGPCTLRTRSAVPPGSGLGSSGALGVALVAALDAAAGTSRRAAETAEEAWRLEAIDAALAGGKQDQYAAALGGFLHLTFQDGAVTPRVLPVGPGFAGELASHTVVCYTGSSRISSRTITRVMGRYEEGDPQVADALHGMVDVAERSAEALQAGDLARVATLLTENWRHQQRLDPAMRTDAMARLESVMRSAGALGGKAAGAGAGGSMFFVVAGDRAEAERAARAAGATVLPLAWSHEGVLVS